MKRRLTTQRTRGLTLVEVLISIVVVAVAAAVLIPALQPARVPGCGRVSCVSNLKQIGLALRMWSGDHNDRFPWSVSTNEGGTMEFAGTTQVFRHYLALSNELTSPKVLACNRDASRTRASSWSDVTNNKAHPSYFLGLTADETRPQMILTGDRNLIINGRLVWGVTRIASNTVLGMVPRFHTNHINVGLADGSVQQSTVTTLQKLNGAQFASITNQSVMLGIP